MACQVPGQALVQLEGVSTSCGPGSRMVTGSVTRPNTPLSSVATNYTVAFCTIVWEETGLPHFLLSLLKAIIWSQLAVGSRESRNSWRITLANVGRHQTLRLAVLHSSL